MGVYTLVKVAEGTTKLVKVARILITTGRVAMTAQSVIDVVKEYKDRKEHSC